MPHDTPLISTIVAGLVLAFILGALANRLRIPPLVGYLIAGVVVGPYTPGFIANQQLAQELAEIGVILLMFGVGLHFSLKDLLSVQALAVPGALVRIAGGTVMGLGLGLMLGWSIGAGLLFGLALSVASTVVLLKTLQDRHLVDSERGRIAVGWVIVEDIAMILALVLIPAIASIWGFVEARPSDPFVRFIERVLGTRLDILGVLAVTLVKLAAFVGFMLVVGRRLIPLLLHFTAHTGSRELFRLAVLAIALGVAAGAAYLFGVSLALGAFFAGMILSESELSHRAAEESLPLRDAFAVLFFVAVGMLFDPMILVEQPLAVVGTLAIILLGKSLIAFLAVIAFRRSVATALGISASLAQIGEFSFILAALGVSLGLLPPEGRDLILAGAMLSIIANPALFWLVDRLRPALEDRIRRPETEPALDLEPRLTPNPEAPIAAPRAADAPPTPVALSGHTVLIGYGRVGTVVAHGLSQAGRAFVVVEDAESRVAAAHAAGYEVVVGNAASSEVLRLANVAAAAAVVVAIPNVFEAGQAAEQCRKANSKALIVARAHFHEEEEHLLHLGASAVLTGEREIALGILERLAPPATGTGAAAAEAELATLEPETLDVPLEDEADAGLEILPPEAEPTRAEPEPEPQQPVRAPARIAGEPFALSGAGRQRPAEAAAPVPEVTPEPPPNQ